MHYALISFRTLAAVAVYAALSACGGGGGASAPNPAPPTPPPVSPAPPVAALPDPATAPALKNEFASSFKIGAAIEPGSLDNPSDRALLLKHYSSLTAENAMKPDTLAPSDPGSTRSYVFAPADRIVDFAMANDMEVHGHTLVWHQMAPDWFFARAEGMDDAAYRNAVSQRLYDYVFDVVTHFKGRVTSWDVVNEVTSDISGETFRTSSRWYEAFSSGNADGREYVKVAFEAARAADPTSTLFLNDYSTEFPAKLERVLAVIEYVESFGIEVDGVGHQFHLQRSSSAAQVEAAIESVSTRNLLNRVTELDISIYSDPVSCFSDRVACQLDYGANFSSIPPQIVSEQARLFRALFQIFVANDAMLGTVTTWGISDAHTWLNFYPVERTNRPLLFDVSGQPKLAFWAVADPAFNIP